MAFRKQRLLNRLLVVSVFLLLPPGSLYAGVCKAVSLGGNVNVRVKPDLNSEVVAQLDKGEEVDVLEKGPEWTKVNAPSHSECWVYAGCLDNSKVKKDSVNLRCGPGTAFPVLDRLEKGACVNIIKKFGNWVKVCPPSSGFPVWVSSRYLEFSNVERKVKDVLVSQPAEEPYHEMPVPSVKSETALDDVELVTYSGILRDLGVIINRPGTYKLVTVNGRKWICIIKSRTLDVNPYVNREVRIEGVIIARSSNWDVPVIELKKLYLIK